MIVGVLLIPLSAVGAVVFTDRAATATGETTTTQPSAQQSVAQLVYSGVEATSEDLAYACGDGGMLLVEAERSGTITELQQSALDALRGICESQGTPLPGKDAPPPIIETRTVTVEVAPGPPPAAPPADETVGTDESQTEETEQTEEEHESNDDDSKDDSSESDPDPQEKYLAVRQQAIDEIDYAVSVGGKQEKIDEARRKLDEAERAASEGNYEGAISKAYEAIGKAREAIGEDDD